MSLFQLREYWRSTCGTDEEFDNGCMVLGNVDNEATGEQKIVMGSFQGVLRIYSPKSREYSADHLLMEMQLNAPILQLAIGRFTLDPGVSLAVLHPRVIIVYKVRRRRNEIVNHSSTQNWKIFVFFRGGLNSYYFVGSYSFSFVCSGFV